MTAFLHGVEIVEVDTGPRPIQTVKSSVIGLVGTAPDACPAVPATAIVGSELTNTSLLMVAALPGAVGNNIQVVLVDPGSADSTLALTTSGTRVEVSLETDGNSDLISTAIEVVTLINDADIIVTAAHYGTSDGSGVMKAQSQFLSGGASEPFPYNKPVLIAGSQIEAAKLGDTGTLPLAMTAIFNQVGAMVIVVRVEECADASDTIGNVIGGVDDNGQYTGMQAFLGAECVTGVQPKILIAPGFTDDQCVASALQPIADRMRAIALIEGPDTTDEDAIAYRNNFGNKRLYLSDPGVLAFDTVTSEEIKVSNSAYVAGLIARIDNQLGFWWSPSNQLIYGINGLTRPVDFTLGDVNSRANYLNENEVTTIIQQDGYRLWGNRTCSSDPKWAFINVVRTADILNDSLQREHLWAVDRCINKTYIADVQAGVNAYIRSLIAMGALLGGKCWPDPELNTPENMAAGKVYWNFDFTPPAPAEHMTFQSILTDDYYTTITAEAA